MIRKTIERDSEYTMMLDDVNGDGSVLYIGLALPGTGTDVAGWSIKRYGVTGNITTLDWAVSNSNFDKAWDDRASYSYS